MNYQETLNFIHSLDKFGSRPGLDRVKRLFSLTPQILSQSFVHVAGTNGKGSVCVMLSHILEKAGYRVGLFISPYITEFRERIQINNRPVSKDTLTEAVEYYRPLLKKLNDEGVIITEFEFLTVIAFYIFHRQECEVIVCETGMGGLLDSTNVIERPLCSVITKVDLDHTAILGDTIEEITLQKCGIIKENRITVTAPQDEAVSKIIRRTAEEKHNLLFSAEDIMPHDIDCSLRGIDFSYMREKMHLPLVGRHQLDNLKCALACVKALNLFGHLHISPLHIKDGLSSVSHPARFERLSDKPVIILDGAHNKNGIKAFTDAVKTYYGYTGKTLIIGMLADKDSSVELLKGLFKRIITTDIDNPRALDAEELAQRCRAVSGNVEVIRDPKDALDKALSYKDDIFICGSLYLAGEIRPYILQTSK